MPKLSIVIPAYNERRTLRSLLDGFVNAQLVAPELGALSSGASVGLRLVGEALVGLNEGQTFGAGLEAFARANLATSRTLVLEIADRIGAWVARQRV